MSEPKKRSTAKKPAEQPVDPQPVQPKSPKGGAKGTRQQAKSQPDTAKPPLPTLQPVGKPSPAPKLPFGNPQQAGQAVQPSPKVPLPASQPPTPPAFPPRPPSGLFGSARPNARVMWEILPTHDTVVKIDTSAIQIDLFKLVGVQPPALETLEKDPSQAAYWGNAIAGVPSAVAQVISDFLDLNPGAETALKEKLDSAWSALELKGAVLIYNWREEAKVSFTTRLQAIGQPPIALRASDPLLVLNILSRARSNTLIGNMPSALEKPFLERQIFTDDARVVAWVKASGFTEETLVEPPLDDSDLKAED